MQTNSNVLKQAETVGAELAALWKGLPDKGLLGMLLIAWLVLFHVAGNATLGFVKTRSLFGWMHYVYTTSPEDEFCQFVPVAVLALVIWKRAELGAVAKHAWWPGFGLVALGALIHVGGFLGQQTRVSIVGFFVGLYGLMGMVWGWRWLKAVFFPFFLFAFCMPLGTVSDALTVPLRLISSQVTVFVTNSILALDVVRYGNILMDPAGGYQYEVAAACSGIRSLTVILVLNLVYAFMYLRRAWTRGIMLLLVPPVAILGNVVRLTSIVIAAEAAGQSAGVFMDKWFGFVTFAIALGVVLFVGDRLRLLETRLDAPTADRADALGPEGSPS